MTHFELNQNHLLIVICIVSFATAQFFYCLGVLVKVAGTISKKKYTASSIENIVNNLSNLFAAIFLPSLAYLVESEFSLQPYLTLVAIAYLATAILCAVMLLNINLLVRLFIQIIANYETNRSMPRAILSTFRGGLVYQTQTPPEWTISLVTKKRKKYFFSAFVAYLPATSGFFVAFFLALLFPENRLAFAQAAVFIHGIGIVMLSLYVWPPLSSALDASENTEVWTPAVVSYMLGRLSTYLVLCSVALIGIAMTSERSILLSL